MTTARETIEKDEQRLMTSEPENQAEAHNLKLIDEAIASAKIAAHSCRNELARDHFEFALALIRESWIAESGQEARPATKVVEDVNEAMNLFARIIKHGRQS